MAMRKKYAIVEEVHVEFSVDDVARALMGDDFDPNQSYTMSVLANGGQKMQIQDQPGVSLLITQTSREEVTHEERKARKKRNATPPAGMMEGGAG